MLRLRVVCAAEGMNWPFEVEMFLERREVVLASSANDTTLLRETDFRLDEAVPGRSSLSRLSAAGDCDKGVVEGVAESAASWAGGSTVELLDSRPAR